MATFSDWQDDLLPHLPGAVRAVVERAFYTTARAFYLQTRSWRTTLGLFTININQTVIPLEPVDGQTSICFLEAAWLNGAPMLVYTGPTCDPAKSPGTPGAIWLRDATTAVLNASTQEKLEKALQLELSVQPRLGGSPRLPDVAATHHYEGLKAGTLATMLSQANKPYTNPTMAQYNARLFETKKVEARAQILQGYTGGPPPWRYQTVPMR